MKFSHREFEALRRERGRTAQLFITDRCPVGCAHCSVDSRPDSPALSDFTQFGRIVDWIADNKALEVVAISGGEPFVERRGLSLATRRFAAAGKLQVIYTSGIWAARERVPGWIRDVLDRCACIYLSTDAYHAEALDDDCIIRAAREIAATEAWIVLQVLDQGPARERAAKLLNEAFGGRWDQRAEINLVPPLAHGRGAQLFTPRVRIEGHAFGPCSALRSPVIRYDGKVSACSNEGAIMSQGPRRLRQRARDTKGLDKAIRRLQGDPLLRVISDSGLGVLTEHPQFKDLANERFSVNCELCWKMLERIPEGSDRLIDAFNAVNDED